MKNKYKLLIAAGVALIAIAVVLAIVLSRPSSPKAKPAAVASGCSLISSAEATKLLGNGTVLEQAKTERVQSVNVTGCQYSNVKASKTLIIGQKIAPTSYAEQSMQQSFFSNVSKGEAEIKFANYVGFTYPKQPASIRIWFKNTWVQVNSSSQKISEAALTNFVKTH